VCVCVFVMCGVYVVCGIYVICVYVYVMCVCVCVCVCGVYKGRGVRFSSQHPLSGLQHL